MTRKKKPTGKKPLTAKQKKLATLLPAVAAGTKTKRQAIREAGYAESSANQQQEVLGALRNNVLMQEALKKAGFTTQYLAEGIVEGTTASEGKERIVEKNDGTVEHQAKPDYRTRALYYKMGADMLDVFPSQKHQHEFLPPATYGDLERGPKAKSPAEAQKLAEQMQDEDD